MAVPLPASPHVGATETLPARAVSLWWHNLQVLTVLTIGNACTGGVYGFAGLAYNGYNTGVMAAVVLRRDPHILSGFTVFAALEIIALAVAAAAAGLAPWAAFGFVRVGWGRLVLAWVFAGGLFAVAAVIEATVGARVS